MWVDRNGKGVTMAPLCVPEIEKNFKRLDLKLDQHARIFAFLFCKAGALSACAKWKL